MNLHPTIVWKLSKFCILSNAFNQSYLFLARFCCRVSPYIFLLVHPLQGSFALGIFCILFILSCGNCRISHHAKTEFLQRVVLLQQPGQENDIFASTYLTVDIVHILMPHSFRLSNYIFWAYSISFILV